jgi:hypothetical protein
LIGDWKFINGSILMARARIAERAEGQGLRRALKLYEDAMAAYMTPTFSPVGLSRVLRHVSNLESGKDLERAFRHALVSAVLYPVGENIEGLLDVADSLYAASTRTGAFQRTWRESQQQLLEMNSNGFELLQGLVLKFGSTSAAREHLSRSLADVRSAVGRELGMDYRMLE